MRLVADASVLVGTVRPSGYPGIPADWPTAALAMMIDAGIWTANADFLGCGIPTWTTDTLIAEIEQ